MKLIISKFFSQYTLLALTLGLILFPEANVLAQNFVPLVGIPGVGTNTQNIGSYMNAIYRLSITLAALLAVLILIKAGIKYMFSEIVTSKEDAKKDIKGALLGLLLIISAVLILSTINEDLTNFSIVISPLDVSGLERPGGNEGRGQGEDSVESLCNDIDSTGGCEFHTCEILFDRVVSYAAAGCAIGGTAGAISGGITGSAVPILGNIAGFFTGGTLGCVGGALTGSLAGSATDVTFCRAGCSLASGTYITEGSRAGYCSVPKNSELFNRVQLRLAEETANRERAENQAVIAGAEVREISDALEYFDNLSGLSEDDFDYITLESSSDIPIEDLGIIGRSVDVTTRQQIEEDLIDAGLVSYVPLVRNGLTPEDLENNSEYEIMVANAETIMRNRCDSVQRVSEKITASGITTFMGITRIYCIQNPN